MLANSCMRSAAVVEQLHQLFASFDFYSRVFHILVDFTTYGTVHGEAVKNKKKKT